MWILRAPDGDLVGALGKFALENRGRGQKPHPRQHLPVEAAAQRLAPFLDAATELMRVMARACGHRRLKNFGREDLST
jgi:hypothetical protein